MVNKHFISAYIFPIILKELVHLLPTTGTVLYCTLSLANINTCSYRPGFIENCEH